MNKAIEARQPAANAAPDQQPRGRPFAKGVSGNPAGKSPGTKNRATRILEALLEGEAEAVTRAVVDKAHRPSSTVR
jgi:hypothetical protein